MPTFADTTVTTFPWRGRATAEELAHWSAVANEAAAKLAEDAVARDRAGKDPVVELDLLRSLGLANLIVPAELGGAGAHFETALRVVRIIGAADASVGQVLLYSYINVLSSILSAGPERGAEWLRRSAEGSWIWGDSVNPLDPELVLTPDGDAFRLNGFKRYSTGASVGDKFTVNATVKGGDLDGQVLAFVLDRDRDGVVLGGDWDNLGQRLSASGSVRYDNALVTQGDILGPQTWPPAATAIVPLFQLFLANLYLGVAQGALARGRELVLKRPVGWFLATAATYAEDPIFQRVVGEFASRIAAVEALADAVNKCYDVLVERGLDLTEQERGEFEIEVARVKVVSSEVAVDVANRIFEITGASSTSNKVGLDIFWRNIRTHSVHDPIDYKKVEVGAHYLLGVNQPISLYT